MSWRRKGRAPRAPLSVRPTDPDEAFADDFAMELLMPESEVRRIVSEGGGWIEVLLRFGVPQEIAVRRLRELGLPT